MCWSATALAVALLTCDVPIWAGPRYFTGQKPKGPTTGSVRTLRDQFGGQLRRGSSGALIGRAMTNIGTSLRGLHTANHGRIRAGDLSCSQDADCVRRQGDAVPVPPAPSATPDSTAELSITCTSV